MKFFSCTLVLLTALLNLAACKKENTATPKTAGSTAIPPLKLAAMVLKPSASTAGISTTGTVLAVREVEIKTEIAGKVAKIGFREGEKVSAGQSLIRLHDAELRAQSEKASARYALAQLQEKRLKEQLAVQAISQKEYDQGAADLQGAKADADLVKAQLDKCDLRAPFAGLAGLRGVELGSVIQAGTKITSLQDVSAMRVEFSVPEQQAASMHEGLVVRFTTNGVPDTLRATIYAIESRIDSDTRLLRVRARCNKVKGRLIAGTFARIDLPLHADSSLWVPAQAVVESASGSMVWKVRAGKAELNPFSPGVRTAQEVQAISGLQAGDTILISGIMQVRPGAPVQPVIAP